MGITRYDPMTQSTVIVELILTWENELLAPEHQLVEFSTGHSLVSHDHFKLLFSKKTPHNLKRNLKLFFIFINEGYSRCIFKVGWWVCFCDVDSFLLLNWKVKIRTHKCIYLKLRIFCLHLYNKLHKFHPLMNLINMIDLCHILTLLRMVSEHFCKDP